MSLKKKKKKKKTLFIPLMQYILSAKAHGGQNVVGYKVSHVGGTKFPFFVQLLTHAVKGMLHVLLQCFSRCIFSVNIGHGDNDCSNNSHSNQKCDSYVGNDNNDVWFFISIFVIFFRPPCIYSNPTFYSASAMYRNVSSNKLFCSCLLPKTTLKKYLSTFMSPRSQY